MRQHIFFNLLGHSTEKVDLKPAKMGFWQVYLPLSTLLLAAIGAKLIGPNGGLQVDKQNVSQVTVFVEWPYYETRNTVLKIYGKPVHSLFMASTMYHD